MKKICLLLALIMVLCFVGCSGTDSDAGDGTEETRAKKKKETTSDSEYDSDYDYDTDYNDYVTTKPIDNDTIEVATIESIIGDAEKFANNGYFEKAIKKIEEGIATYPDSVELLVKRDEYAAQLAQQNKQKTLNEAAVLANKEDYLGAMKKIEEAKNDLPGDVDYEIAYDNYCSAYEDSVIAQADSLAANNDYEAAIALVDAAQVNVKNSTKLDTAKTKYKQNLPATYLHNLQPTVYSNKDHNGNIQLDNEYFIINGKVTSFLGDTYTDGIMFKRRMQTSTYIEYNLSGEYTKLTGKVSMIESGSILGLGDFTASTYDLVYLGFVADGERIYTAPLTNPSMDINLNIDLSDVNVLQIHVTAQEEISNRLVNSCVALTGLALYK